MQSLNWQYSSAWDLEDWTIEKRRRGVSWLSAWCQLKFCIDPLCERMQGKWVLVRPRKWQGYYQYSKNFTGHKFCMQGSCMLQPLRKSSKTVPSPSSGLGLYGKFTLTCPSKDMTHGSQQNSIWVVQVSVLWQLISFLIMMVVLKKSHKTRLNAVQVYALIALRCVLKRLPKILHALNSAKGIFSIIQSSRMCNYPEPLTTCQSKHFSLPEFFFFFELNRKTCFQSEVTVERQKLGWRCTW